MAQVLVDGEASCDSAEHCPGPCFDVTRGRELGSTEVCGAGATCVCVEGVACGAGGGCEVPRECFDRSSARFLEGGEPCASSACACLVDANTSADIADISDGVTNGTLDIVTSGEELSDVVVGANVSDSLLDDEATENASTLSDGRANGTARPVDGVEWEDKLWDSENGSNATIGRINDTAPLLDVVVSGDNLLDSEDGTNAIGDDVDNRSDGVPYMCNSTGDCGAVGCYDMTRHEFLLPMESCVVPAGCRCVFAVGPNRSTLDEGDWADPPKDDSVVRCSSSADCAQSGAACYDLSRDQRLMPVQPCTRPASCVCLEDGALDGDALDDDDLYSDVGCNSSDVCTWPGAVCYDRARNRSLTGTEMCALPGGCSCVHGGGNITRSTNDSIACEDGIIVCNHSMACAEFGAVCFDTSQRRSLMPAEACTAHGGCLCAYIGHDSTDEVVAVACSHDSNASMASTTTASTTQAVQWASLSTTTTTTATTTSRATSVTTSRATTTTTTSRATSVTTANMTSSNMTTSNVTTSTPLATSTASWNGSTSVAGMVSATTSASPTAVVSAARARLLGTLVIEVGDPQAFAQDPAVGPAIAAALAVLARVPAGSVAVALAVGRRLDTGRRMAGAVQAKYTIALPSSLEAAAIGERFAASTPAEVTAGLRAAIEEAVGAGVYSVVVKGIGALVIEVDGASPVLVGRVPAPSASADPVPSQAGVAALTAVLSGIACCLGCCVLALCYSAQRAKLRLQDEGRRSLCDADAMEGVGPPTQVVDDGAGPEHVV